MARQVEQRAHLRDGHTLRPGGNLDDLVPGLDLPFVADPQIKPGPTVGDQQGGHPWLVHPQAHPVAGDPRLGDLELRLADPVAVADAHLIVRQSFDREVLPELPVNETVTTELLLPIAVRLDLVDQHRAVLAAMAGEVALPVPVEIEPARHRGPATGCFHTPVCTVASRQGTSWGRPTFTASSLATTHLLLPGSKARFHLFYRLLSSAGRPDDP